jgi:hypothetical protein
LIDARAFLLQQHHRARIAAAPSTCESFRHLGEDHRSRAQGEPLTGPFTTTGKQVEAGARFYMQQNGASVDGKKLAPLV